MLLLKDVRKSYPQPTGGSVTILNVPKLEIRSGEQIVLRGDSGSGKTTLLQIISGITRADSGQVLFDGTDLTKLSESARDRFRAVKMGYVFQTFNLLPAFTALENVRLGMTFGRGKYRLDRAKSLLSQVGLDDRMHYRPSMLSVGQQQRVAVARALANQPRLLLADEPTANVDPGNQQKIIDLLKEVCGKESTALLMVTHSDSISQQFHRVEYLDQINTVLTSEARS
jgi:ABC-type lipoprotein export system ATPase subunit